MASAFDKLARIQRSVRPWKDANFRHLSARARKVVYRALNSYGTPADLSKWDYEKWRECRNCGDVTTAEIMKWLHGPDSRQESPLFFDIYVCPYK